ncbi:hypothetical protein AB0A74_02755 [Saccharothrix sp. NPDC042600]|uniref:hypothetical protein n=1 Tax=Saccharothrix TaxID=2071 RepID=UPI0033D9ABD5|nr:hypothetical protein GCM10017745_66980 [Saccharothrix mutabilis subsp. capreolus]
MINEFEELVSELKSLRRGRGLDAPDLTIRTGRRLRVVLRLDEALRPDELRKGLARRLEDVAAALPDGPRQAVLIAYGLTENSAGARFFKKRVELLATLIERDARTASRRIDEALTMLAEVALAGYRERPGSALEDIPPWRTSMLRTVVVLDQGVPEVFETRRIVTSVEGLDEIELAASIPAVSDGRGSAENMGFDVLYGGTVRARSRRSTSRVAYSLKLPHGLRRHAEHELFLRFRFADERAMRPFYVCTPEFPCERFELRVKFPSVATTGHVWRIDGLLPFEVEDAMAQRKPVAADAAAEVHFVFTNLVPNRSYGAAWALAW